MAQPIGRRVPVSQARRFVGDLVYFAQKLPLCTMQRRMQRRHGGRTLLETEAVLNGPILAELRELAVHAA